MGCFIRRAYIPLEVKVSLSFNLGRHKQSRRLFWSSYLRQTTRVISSSFFPLSLAPPDVHFSPSVPHSLNLTENRVIAVDLKQTIQVDEDLEIRAYYAGHVLGAAMFYARVGDASMVYTGDYNMTPDRHLGAAQIDRLQLDLLIMESTYATTMHDSKYVREREFLKAVQASYTWHHGGKGLEKVEHKLAASENDEPIF